MSQFAITNVLQNARDGITKAIMVMPYEHHEIHAGSHYYVEGYTELGNATTYRMKFTTPNTAKKLHLLPIIDAGGILSVEVWKDATGGMAGGTTRTPINNNFVSANVSSAKCVAGITSSATAVGAKIVNHKEGGISGVGTNRRASGGQFNRENEMILAANKTYYMRLVSGSTGNIVNYHFSWYEHEASTGLKVAD